MNDHKLEESNISSIDSTKDISVKEVEGLCKNITNFFKIKDSNQIQSNHFLF